MFVGNEGTGNYYLTVAFVLGPVAYLCVAIAVFETWKPAGECMLLALVVGPFRPEFWMIVWALAKRLP